MEILDLRHMRSQDLEHLLEEEKQLWQRHLQWDYTASAALIKRFVDAHALPGYAAVDGGRTVGYSFYVYEDYKGLIGDVFVSGAFTDGATESELLRNVIETMQGTPGIRRIETQLMNFGDRPISQCFHSQNFRSFGRKFLFRELVDCPLSSLSQNPDITLAPWDPRWTSEAAHLITRAYHGHIDSAINDQYRSHAGAMRFLDNILHYPGCGRFDAGCSFLAFRKDTSRLCGMVLTSVVRDRVGHITQVCVDPEAQGTGLGFNLICESLQKLQQRRFHTVTLTVTAANSSALRLYEKMQFSTLRDFQAFVWDASGQDRSQPWNHQGNTQEPSAGGASSAPAGSEESDGSGRNSRSRL